MDDPRVRSPGLDRGAALKQRVRALIRAGDRDGIAALADEGHRVMGALIALTYDPEPGVAWGAVHGLGTATDRLADREPGAVRNYLRRLLWLISEESGGICWFAPQGMAEIARRRPGPLGDYIPIAVNLLGEMAEEDLEHFRPGILWAIARLGPLAEPHVDDVLEPIERSLEHPDPTVRGLAVRALAATGRKDRVAGRPALRTDDAELVLWEDGVARSTTVARLARDAAET